jgi:hypothetical protein
VNRREAKAVEKLYRAAGDVCSIPGYRWSRDQIDATRRLLTEAALEVFPYLAKANGMSPEEIKAAQERSAAIREGRDEPAQMRGEAA